MDTTAADTASLHETLTAWFAANGRDLPWRRPGTTPWGVLVSEVMLQQTPVARVEPVWRTWLSRWPTPAALAAATPADVLRAWDRLGYPRRALRLRECAVVITQKYDGEVPDSEDALRSLPGIGEYTAAAVTSFAFRRRAVVLDTNVRRVLTRTLTGAALPPPSLTNPERRQAANLLPATGEAAARWNAAVMELGALVCTARAPRCADCPVQHLCAWRAAGYPPDEHGERRRSQPWNGTDRQARGRVMAVLRAATGPVDSQTLATTWPDAEQRERILASLLTDGLIAVGPHGYTLPS